MRKFYSTVKILIPKEKVEKSTILRVPPSKNCFLFYFSHFTAKISVFLKKTLEVKLYMSSSRCHSHSKKCKIYHRKDFSKKGYRKKG